MTDKNNEGTFEMFSPITRSRDVFSYPVMAHDHVIYVGPLEFPEDEREKIQLIRTAGPDDTIRLIINSPGGYVSLAMSYVSAINESAARIITHAEGSVASAGTLLWLSGTQKTVSPLTEFMFHNYQGGAYGDGANMFSQITFGKAYFDKLLRRFYTGVLTEEEITRIIGGGQVWLDEEEIVKRTGAQLLSKEYLAKCREEAGIPPHEVPQDIAKVPEQEEAKKEVALKFQFPGEEAFELPTDVTAAELDKGFTAKELRAMVDALGQAAGVDVKTEYFVTSRTNKQSLIFVFRNLIAQAVQETLAK